jgi:hypothetical protein
LQKKAPNALKSHDAEMESPKRPKARQGCTHRSALSTPHCR